jgi:hypothetical protein
LTAAAAVVVTAAAAAAGGSQSRMAKFKPQKAAKRQQVQQVSCCFGSVCTAATKLALGRLLQWV